MIKTRHSDTGQHISLQKSLIVLRYYCSHSTDSRHPVSNAAMSIFYLKYYPIVESYTDVTRPRNSLEVVLGSLV